MYKKYQLIPTIVEVFQYTGYDCLKVIDDFVICGYRRDGNNTIIIPWVRNGKAHPGDWIIKDKSGYRVICDKSFHKFYESVPDKEISNEVVNNE